MHRIKVGLTLPIRDLTLILDSLAYVQMHLATACVLRRFELELDDDVVRERDVDVVRDCVIGLPPPESKGIRFKVVRKRV